MPSSGHLGRTGAAPAGVDSDQTLGRVLRERAEHDGFIFLSYQRAEAFEEERLTYGALFERAKAIAATLQVSGARGDRVLILCPPGLAYIAAFFACQLAGRVAVPTYPPRNVKHMGPLQAIVADAGASAILVTSQLSSRLAEWSGAQRLPRRIVIDGISLDAAAAWRDPNLRPEDLAFLQYTSGTTGSPKGVMVTQAQVVKNMGCIVALTGLDASDVGASWLPPYHDMGLVGTLLMPVLAGFPAVLMAPMAFLQRPARWLEAMTEFRATATTAPNFAYQRCVDDVPEEALDVYDLSALRHALCGAEMVRFATLRAFGEKFAPCGFRYERFVPVYGMAETVLLTTGQVSGRGPQTLALDGAALAADQFEVQRRFDGGALPPQTTELGPTVVSCGRVIPGHDLRIVDPDTHQSLPKGAVGEIWLSGPSVAAGYWNKPQVSDATFGCRLADVPESPPYLCTGDLGTLIEGELYVLGRIKELLIIRGRNHYPQDIEATAAEAHPILKPDRAAAFSIEGGLAGIICPDGESASAVLEERLVLVQELERTALRGLDGESVCAAMRQAILQAHEIDPQAIVLLKPASLPRTTSGKIQRARARALFLSGELTEVFRWERAVPASAFVLGESTSTRELENAPTLVRLRALAAEKLGVAPEGIDPDRNLTSLGIDSLAAAQLTASVERALGVTLDASELYDHPTLRALARHLDAEDKMVAQERVEVPPPNDLSDLTDAQVLERASKYLEGAQ